MKRMPSLLSLCFLAACASSREPIRFVPAEEAAWFKFPYELPEPGMQVLPGNVVAAMQLAMEDFLPRHAPPVGETPQAICLQQRQSYDVEAGAVDNGVVWVRVSLSPGACTRGLGPLLDMTATYAVDVQGRRILAVRTP